MNSEQWIEKIKMESGLIFPSHQRAFLIELERASPVSIGALDALVQRYATYGILLHKHLQFLLEILAYQIHLPFDLDDCLHDFLMTHALDYTQIIRASYADRWGKIAQQSSDQVLTYHTSYHALEVALRTNIGIKSLGIFVENNVKNQFLHYLLLTAAKYHDYVQWERGHLMLPEGFHTPEEQTAAQVLGWLIDDFDLTDVQNPSTNALRSLIHYLVKMMIGPGTTLLFGTDRLVNLSTIYYEMENIVHEAGLCAAPSNHALIGAIQAATEVLSAMDKISAGSLDVVYYQTSEETWSSLNTLRQWVSYEPHLMRFFESLSPTTWYYPEHSLLTNIEASAIFNVAHTEMEIELHRASPDALLLRDYIKTGHERFKQAELNPEEFRRHLQQLFIDRRLVEAFMTTYLATIETEQNFARKLVDLGQHINSTLQRLGYVNERGESVYSRVQGAQGMMEVSTEPLTIFTPVRHRSISDVIPTFTHPFLDPQVFDKEAVLLGLLRDHVLSLNITQQAEIIQEILIFSLCQAGVRYANHPDLIHSAEPPSPINCRTPLDALASTEGLYRFHTPQPVERVSSLQSIAELEYEDEPNVGFV